MAGTTGHSKHFEASRRALLKLSLLLPFIPSAARDAAAQGALPQQIPAGTKLVAADQNEALQTLIRASGVQAKLSSNVTYANFLGGPAILEAFRAGALDLATVGNTPPIQAHAAGEKIPIIAARVSSETDYFLAVRPGLKIDSLEELKGTGLLDSRLPSGFSVPTPSDDIALREDEEPLDAGDSLELLLAPAAEPEKGGEG